MERIEILLGAGFDPRPDWFRQLEQAIEAAKADGWNLVRQIVFEGEPYFLDGEPKMATWSVCPCEGDANSSSHPELIDCPFDRRSAP